MTCTGKPILNPFTGRLQLIGTITVSGVVTPSTILKKQSVNDVASASKTTVLTFTLTADTYITKIIGQGEDYAMWYLVVDTADQNLRPSGPDRDKVWTFESPWQLSSGSVIDVKVEHFNTGEQLDFSATLWGYT